MNLPEEEWMDGPDFDVDCIFREPVLNARDAELEARILKALAIEGPWVETEVVGFSELARNDWAALDITYGLWHLSPKTTVGVKVIPDIRKAGHELRLAIPPRQVERHFGRPWAIRPGRVPERIQKLHRETLDKCLALHAVCPLRAILLADEGWTFSVPPDATGIFMHPDVAAAAGLKGEPRGRMFGVPL